MCIRDSGNADGPFIYTGFKPAFVMIKVKSGNNNHWFLFDKHRPRFMFIETMIIGREVVTNALPNEYIESITDGLNTLYVHEDFYKPFRI